MTSNLLSLLAHDALHELIGEAVAWLPEEGLLDALERGELATFPPCTVCGRPAIERRVVVPDRQELGAEPGRTVEVRVDLCVHHRQESNERLEELLLQQHRVASLAPLRSRPALQLEDELGSTDVWVLPTKIVAMRWPSRLVGGLVRAWTLGRPVRPPEPWQGGLER